MPTVAAVFSRLPARLGTERRIQVAVMATQGAHPESGPEHGRR